MTSLKDDYTLLAPGPVNLHPEVRKALALPMIHHRTPEFDKIFKSTLNDLKKIFQTEQDVYMLSCSGSGGMECLLINLLRPQDKVLCIINGKFGERWAQMAETYGAQVFTITTAWGEACTVEQISEHFSQHPDTQLVLCQACETSTAVANPLQEIGAFVKNTQALFLVDGITAVGAYDIPMDAWFIDGLVAGSQKAFMLPTGMAFVSFSQKAWERVENNRNPRFYFDIRKEKEANQKGESFFSANVSIIRALQVVLNLILQKGLQNHFAEIHRRAEFTRTFIQRLGLKLYAQSPSDSVTALTLPPQVDGQKLRQHLEDTYRVTVMGGQDQARGKIIRVGHMGYIEDRDLKRFILCLLEGIRSFDSAFLKGLTLESLDQEMEKWLKEHP